MPVSTASATSLKEDVLEAARHLLAKGGYGGLSMRRLAGIVGCKAPSLYYHFENKDRIVHALIDEGYDRQYEALEVAAAHHPDHPLRRIEARARAYLAFALSHPEYYRIMYLLRTDEMTRYPKENYRRTRRSLQRSTTDLEEAVRRGLITAKGDPYIRATAQFATLHGAVALLLSGRLDATLDREAVVEQVLRRALDFSPAARNSIQHPARLSE